MKLKREDILHVAKLAHLEIDEKDIAAQLDGFNEILGYIEKLNELNTDHVDPTAQILADQDQNFTPMSDDQVLPSMDPDEALKNSPARQDHFFMVPRMIEMEE